MLGGFQYYGYFAIEFNNLGLGCGLVVGLENLLLFLKKVLNSIQKFSFGPCGFQEVHGF